MLKGETNERPLLAWMSTAILAPLAQTVGGIGWETVLIACVICGVIYWGMIKLHIEETIQSKFLRIYVPTWAGIKIAYMLPLVSQCWQIDNGGKIIPYVLLGLAGWMTISGEQVPLRTGAILSIVVAIGVMVTMLGAADEIKPQWLQMSKIIIEPDLVVSLLLPLAGIHMVRSAGNKKIAGYLSVCIAVATIMAVTINGVLSKETAINSLNGLYEVSRTVSILSIAKRFESIAATTCMLSWFLMLSLYVKAIYDVVPTENRNRCVCGILAAGSAAYYGNIVISSELILVLDSVFCLSYVLYQKKDRKSQKRG